MNSPDQHIVVRRPQDLSVNWAQRIVNRYAANARVGDVKVHSVDIGTSTRLRIEVNHDAPELVPTRWFVKTPSLAIKSRLITALPRFLQKEVRFYKSLSANIPVKLPEILAAETRFGGGSILVMTDLSASDFTPGRADDTLTLGQAEQVVERLAQLHGRYWNNPGLLKNHRWLKGFSHDIENHMGSLLAVPLMKGGLKHADSLIKRRLHSPAIRYAANRRQARRKLANESQTLVHYDCHPGNLFWTQSEPGFLDWQLVRIGEGIGDVAYFLATSLEPEVRRSHEKQLLNQYADSLSASGVIGIDEGKLFQRYRAHLVYPFEAMVVTLAIGGMMNRDSNLELIRRTAAAVDDHDSFAVLEA